MCDGNRRRATLVAVAVAVVVGGLLWLLVRPSEPEPPVVSVLLDDEDLGDIEPGFQRGLWEASLEPLPLPGWIPPAVGRVVRVPTHVRGWIQPDTDRKVVIVGSRLQLPLLTGAAFDGLASSVAADAADEFTIAAVSGARGFVKAPNGPDAPAREYWACSARAGWCSPSSCPHPMRPRVGTCG